MFDVFGLPLHPLVVHAVVVLLPLSALGLIACVVVGRWRRTFAGLSVLGLIVGTVSAFVAMLSGNALAAQVGVPATHQALGQVLPWVALATLVLGSVWYFLQRGKDQQAPLTRGMGLVAAVAALASVTMTVLVGHSGATAVWGGTTAASTTSATASASSSSESYTLDEVKQHNQATDCWAAIEGEVYNLTDWVNQHPGGADHIVAICGTDATKAFEQQHAGQQRPASELKQFLIGTLA